MSVEAAHITHFGKWLFDRDPAMFQKIAGYEEHFGLTINRAKSVGQLADAGSPTIPQGFEDVVEASQRSGEAYPWQVLISPEKWKLPAGAFKKDGGPI